MKRETKPAVPVRQESKPSASTAEMIRALVNNVQDYAVILLDPQGNVLTWNAGAERLKGWKAKEIIGQHFSRFYPPEDIERGKTAMELRTAADQGRFEDEGWRLRKDGTRFWAKRDHYCAAR
jgi:PAS domain S-box-containing protein